MTTVSHTERIILANHVYGPNTGGPVSSLPGFNILDKKELHSGLEIYAIQKDGSKEIVFVTRGSDDEKDWAFDGPNMMHFFGNINQQDKEALTFVDEFVHGEKYIGQGFIYSAAGDSKGGTIAQIIAHTFGFCGTASEPAAGGGVVKTQEYLDFVKNELVTVDTPRGIPYGGFCNLAEVGSLATWGSSLWPGTEHLGVTLSLDFVDFDLTNGLIAAIETQHTERDNRIAALLSAGAPGEVDPIYVLLNKQIEVYEQKISILEEELARKTSFTYDVEKETPTEIEELKASINYINIQRENFETGRDALIIGSYGDREDGYVDPWINDFLRGVGVQGQDVDLAERIGIDPEDLLLPKILYKPNDPDAYLLYPNGTIVHTAVIAGTGGAGYSESLNRDNLPLTSEELLDQLLDLGVPAEEAQKLAFDSAIARAEASQIDSESERDHDARVHQILVETGEAMRAGELAVIQAGNNLLKTFESSDSDDIIQACIDYFSAIEDRQDSSAKDDGSVTGSLDEDTEAFLDSLSSLITLGQAIDLGEGWSIVGDSIGLLQQIDHYLELSGGDYGDLIDDDISSYLSLGSAAINLIQALESGDDWSAVQSSVGLLQSIESYYSSLSGSEITALDAELGFDTGEVLAGLGSVVGLAINISQLDDVLESGDAGAIATTVASTINNAINVYNAGASLMGTAGLVCNNIPYVGYAVAVFMALDGDVQGGGEQAVITAAGKVLSLIPVYGPFAYIALQLASATRYMDGQIIDTESVEESLDDCIPGLGILAQLHFAGIEVPSQMADELYNALAGISGFNLDFYEQIGADIPEEMHAEFEFNQIMAEAGNPLHLAQYIVDLDDFSLSDFWESTLITPAVTAWIDQFKNMPDFLVSTVTETPKLIYELASSMASPGDVVSILDGIFGWDDPPEATTSFYLDGNGDVQMSVSGDGSMQESAAALGQSMTTLLENYSNNGGRLVIDGTMPSLKVIGGESSQIVYGDTGGGKIVVEFDDVSDSLTLLQGVMYARDHGERLDTAIALSTDMEGTIDFAQVDSIMAGYGFVKKGDTYTFGETTSRTGITMGSGVIHGGGNVGPEGQTFTATSDDFKSLPIPVDQLPSQRMGEINRIISLNNLFTGRGAELMAMALVFPGYLCMTGTAESNDVGLINQGYVLPVSPFDLENLYGQAIVTAQPVDGVTSQSGNGLFPVVSDLDQLRQFFQDIGIGQLETYDWPDDFLADSAYYFRTSVGDNHFFAEGSGASWWQPDQSNILFDQIRALDETNQGFLEDSSEIFSGQRIYDDITATGQEGIDDTNGTSPISVSDDGPHFIMAEDSILRFLPVELVEQTSAGTYSSNEDNYIFDSFGQVKNGHVWIDDQGDIRFEPTPGFVGTASFTYSVINAAGAVEERKATILVSNVNDQPTLQDDHFVLQEGEVLYLDLLLNNDSDPEGDTLLIDHLRDVEHGEVTMVNGRLAFIPDDGYYGDVEFSYWVRDHLDSYPVPANVTISYQDSNNGVTANDDRFIVLENNVLITSVEKLLANDVEYDGESITFVGLAGADHGSVVMTVDGTINFTPDEDYSGGDAGFRYRVQDESGNISTGYAAVGVVDVRNAPVIISDTFGAILEDEILTFTPDEVANFASDSDGDSLHLSFVANIIGGSFVIQDGYYTFVPDTDYSGPASFDYTVSDNHGGLTDGHLEFAVNPVNDAVRTGVDQLDCVEDFTAAISINEILANDIDVEGEQISFVGLADAVNGNAEVDNTGTITFTPASNYFGNDAGFEYIVQDSHGLESTGWVQVLVTGENDAPEIINNSLSIQEDQIVTFDSAVLSGLIQDVDDDPLTVVVEDGIGGIVSQENGRYTFCPDANYNGSGSVYVTATDDSGETVSTIIDLDILAVDDAAECGNDQFVIPEEQPVITTISALMANDSDVDGPLEFVALGESHHGTVSVNEDGEITFIPETDYAGEEAGFTYTVKDPENNEAEGRVIIRVENINDFPEIISHSLTGNEDEPIVFDAATMSRFIKDIDGDDVTLTSIDDVTGGRIETNGPTYTFFPDDNYHGSASLAYKAIDGNGGQVSGILNLDLLAVDDLTSFGEDAFTTLEEEPLVTNVAELLANDTDDDGNGTLTFLGVEAAQHGNVSLAVDGTITFMPNPDYSGEDAGFCYRVRDDEGTESSGRVTVSVVNTNDAPQITGNRLFIYEDDTLAFTEEEVAKFLFDADNDLLHLDMVANVEGGRVELANGVYTFIPDQDFYGEASLDYIARNNNGEEVSSSLDIGIIPVNDLPSVAPRSFATTEDQEIILDINSLMAGADDVEDGTSLKFGGIDSSLHGDVYVDVNGKVHFLPDADYFGTGSFMYNVLDSEGGTGKGYVNVTIAGVNDAPVALDDDKILAWSNNQYENVFPSSVFLANDYDVDFDSLQIDLVGNAEYGTITVDGDGAIHYLAPVDNWVGIDSFTYRISDGNGGFAEAKAEIDVKINTSPDMYSELVFTSEDVISLLSQEDLLANDSDIDGDKLQITAVDQAEHCNVALGADGNITFTPELNFNNCYPGQACFRYTVSDGISDPVSAVAFFDIDPVNDKPILTPERIDGAVEDNNFSFNVSDLIANDTDVEMISPYEEDAIFFAGVWGADHGSISYDPVTGDIYYIPNANFCGNEHFNYGMVDSYGDLSVITSQIYVKPVNDMPIVEEDIGSAAEEYIWNYYSISGLVSNDYDVDGDSLTINNPHIVDGNGDVSISGGNLAVKPAIGEDRLVVEYTVSDGHGGEVQSRLTIPHILEHNFAPEFTNIYRLTWKSSVGSRTIFSFQVQDKNGGDSWVPAGMGDIASISAAHLSTNYPGATLTQESGYYGHFSFSYWPILNENTDYYATFTLTAADMSGATGTIFVDFEKMGETVGPIYSYQYNPVVLDLDGDGVELLSIDEGITFDWNYDCIPDATGWVSPDDGMLVYDYNNDGVITNADELSLKDYAPEATTDLEGLRAFDSNEDGVFDITDDAWQDFGVWQDSNSDGKTDDGEFQTLDDLSITSINLQSDEVYQEQEGNYVYGTTTCQMKDGTEQEVGDVGLTGDEVSDSDQQDEWEAIPESEQYPSDAGTPVEELSEEITGDGDELSLEMEKEITPELPEEEILPGQPEMNRVYEQLVSDMAVPSESPVDQIAIPITEPVILPECIEDLTDPVESFPTVA